MFVAFRIRSLIGTSKFRNFYIRQTILFVAIVPEFLHKTIHISCILCTPACYVFQSFAQSCLEIAWLIWRLFNNYCTTCVTTCTIFLVETRHNNSQNWYVSLYTCTRFDENCNSWNAIRTAENWILQLNKFPEYPKANSNIYFPYSWRNQKLRDLISYGIKQ